MVRVGKLGKAYIYIYIYSIPYDSKQARKATHTHIYSTSVCRDGHDNLTLLSFPVLAFAFFFLDSAGVHMSVSLSSLDLPASEQCKEGTGRMQAR